MNYKISYKQKAYDDILRHKKSGQTKLVAKIADFIRQLKVAPKEGLGHPEPLKAYGEKTVFSRRINQKHRLVYEIFEEKCEVEILSAYGHYDD